MLAGRTKAQIHGNRVAGGNKTSAARYRGGRGGHVRICSGFVGASGERSKMRWRPMYSGANTRESEETISLVQPMRFHCNEVVAGWSISTRPAPNSRPDAATGDYR